MNLNQVLEATQQFSFEQIELLVDILYKRQVETRREMIAENADAAKKAFKNGELQSETADSLIRRLHDSFASQDE